MILRQKKKRYQSNSLPNTKFDMEKKYEIMVLKMKYMEIRGA